MDTMVRGQHAVREPFQDAARRPTGVLAHGFLSRVRPSSSAGPHLSESSTCAFGIASISVDAEHAPWSFLALSKHVFCERTQQVRGLLFRHAFEWCRIQRDEDLLSESLSNPKSSRWREGCFHWKNRSVTKTTSTKRSNSASPLEHSSHYARLVPCSHACSGTAAVRGRQ